MKPVPYFPGSTVVVNNERWIVDMWTSRNGERCLHCHLEGDFNTHARFNYDDIVKDNAPSAETSTPF